MRSRVNFSVRLYFEMGLFNNWQLLIIRLLCFLGWFSTFALAQPMGEVLTGGYVEFHSLGVTFIANLAVFITCLIRGRLDVEIGATDVLDILSSPKLKNINGIQNGKGLTTCTEEAPQTASTGEGAPQTAYTEEEATQTGIEGCLDDFRLLLTEGGGCLEDFRSLLTEGGGGLHTEGEATETASTEGGLHSEEEATQTTSTGGGCLHYFRLLQNVFRQFFHKEEDQQTASTETASTGTKGLKTASVVMLSYGKPNLSITDFMRYNDPFVDSILLEYVPVVRMELTREDLPVAAAISNENVGEELTREDLPVADAINNANVTAEHTPGVILERCRLEHSCNCIVFWTVEKITEMLVPRMPGTLKQLSDFLCLLPCLTCLTNGCHGCNREGLSPVEQSDEGCRARESDSKVVCEILDEVEAGSIRPGKPICICIPMNDAHCDNWTELLVRSLRSKDAESRGVRVKASEAMEDYLAQGRGGAKESVKYNILSYIVPRLIEIFINGVLTICFRVDGFSSSLIARRAVRDYVVDSKGSGLAANAFLTKAVVKCGANNTRVCQVLTFRTNLLGIRCLSLIVGCVNLFSFIGWAVLISSMPWSSRRPSMPGVVVIIAAILIAFVMDVVCFTYSSHRSGRFLHAHRGLIWALFIAWVLTLALEVFISSTSNIFSVAMMALFLLVLIHPRPSRWVLSSLRDRFRRGRVLNDPGFNLFIPLFAMVLFLEVFAIAILIVLIQWSIQSGEKYIGRWIYGALQALVWLKWAAGSYILNFEKSLEFLGESPHTWGILVHSSAFMLNAVLAGVRCKWKLSNLWPWKHHHLVPRKLGP